MKLWLSKNSEVPVRDQLITQITIGVLSGGLSVGDKLPSTREIARRFLIHSNTVSSAYQKLADDGWLEFRKGSGFYIRDADQADIDREIQLERLISGLFKSAQEIGFTPREVRERIGRRMVARPPDRIVVIEADAGLRDIIVAELSGAAEREVTGIDRSGLDRVRDFETVVFVAMADEWSRIENLLPPGKICVYLKARSVSDAMAGQRRPSDDELVAVVSGWDKFLLMAKTFLVAANVDPAALLIRRTDGPEWQKGLASATMIICDSLTASRLPVEERVRPFKIVSDESLAEIIRTLNLTSESK
jgi:GntR family transcriptional regulator